MVFEGDRIQHLSVKSLVRFWVTGRETLHLSSYHVAVEILKLDYGARLALIRSGVTLQTQ